MVLTIAQLGSRPLSRRCLRLLDDHDEIRVAAVVTYPAGHDGWWDGSLRQEARQLGYPVVEESELFEFDLDYLLSTLYFEILGPELLEHPTHGGLNLHQAELPRYRGSNTFSHAIMNAREDDYWQYGTTMHFMSEEVDRGDIVDRAFVPITDDDTAKSLYEKTEDASVELFADLLPKIVSGEVREMRTPQEAFEGPSYFYPKDSLDGEKYIEPSTLADPTRQQAVADRIRALHFPPFEPAYTELDGQTVYLPADYEYD